MAIPARAITRLGDVMLLAIRLVPPGKSAPHSYRRRWWKCGGGLCERRPSGPDQPLLPTSMRRGGISATQMAPEPEIHGGQRGKGEAEQEAGVFGAGFGLLGGVANRRAQFAGAQAGWVCGRVCGSVCGWAQRPS